MCDEDQDLPSGQQNAFCGAYDLAEQLIDQHGYSRDEIGRGFLTAALDQLRRSIGNRETAKLLYEAADDYAVRG